MPLRLTSGRAHAVRAAVLLVQLLLLATGPGLRLTPLCHCDRPHPEASESPLCCASCEGAGTRTTVVAAYPCPVRHYLYTIHGTLFAPPEQIRELAIAEREDPLGISWDHGDAKASYRSRAPPEFDWPI